MARTLPVELLPLEALQGLVDAWYERARERILARTPDVDLGTLESTRTAEERAETEGHRHIARALHWYAQILWEGAECSLTSEKALRDAAWAYEFVRVRARAMRAVAAELTGSLDGPGGDEEYQRQLIDIDQARRHWRI